MPRIAFVWDSEKAIQASCYLIGRIGRIDRVVLTKLLYYADRDHFLAEGAPITGDAQRAMKHGPVPFNTYAMLSGERDESEEWIKFVHEEDWSLSVRLDPGTARLSPSEVAALDSVVQDHGRKGKWELVAETHQLPEYVKTYEDGLSPPIPYETILQCYEMGDGSRFRKGRPVVSRRSMAAMPCPWPAWQ